MAGDRRRQRGALKTLALEPDLRLRALRDLSARLIFGEQYLTSELFESFRYIGMSMETDENMFPPLLRGYAPEVAGLPAPTPP